jgi:integrase
MSSTSIKFSKTTVSDLTPAPAGKRLEYLDTVQPGLRLRVTDTGAKTYSVYARVKGGDLERITLGSAEKLTPENARTQAKQIVAKMATGHSFKAASRAARGEIDFSGLFALYIEGNTMRPRSKAEFEGMHRRYIADNIGKLKLTAVTHKSVMGLHSGLAQIPTTANRTVSLVKAVFNWAREHELWDGSNPAERIKKNRENSRQRYLQPAELARFFEALNESEQPARDFFMMALLTGARRSNVLAMQWRDIDLLEAVWRIRAEDAKAGDEMTIPLTPEAMAVLTQRRADLGKDKPWVFPADSKTGHYMEPKRAWATLQKRAGLEDLHIHDLRRTMGSWLVRTGANTAINAKALGHKSMQAAAVYQRIADTDPVREAMERATTAFMGGGK